MWLADAEGEESWTTNQGLYLSISIMSIPCLSPHAPRGLAPNTRYTRCTMSSWVHLCCVTLNAPPRRLISPTFSTSCVFWQFGKWQRGADRSGKHLQVRVHQTPEEIQQLQWTGEKSCQSNSPLSLPEPFKDKQETTLILVLFRTFSLFRKSYLLNSNEVLNPLIESDLVWVPYLSLFITYNFTLIFCLDHSSHSHCSRSFMFSRFRQLLSEKK